MYFIQVGVHYRTSDLSVREKFVFPQEPLELTAANQQLNKMPHIIENVIVSTCNRTEIYAVVDEEIQGYDSIIMFLTHTFSLPREPIEQIIEFRLEDEAITHLLRVTTGLDSMVVGETEILGQMKHAFLIAQQAHTTKKLCNELFKQAITLGKQAHRDTRVSSYPLSISHLAVQLCANQIPYFHKRRVLVVGAGTIGMSTVNQLIAYGVENIVLMNRSVEKTQTQIDHKRVEVHSYQALYKQLSMADVVFFAIRKENYILTNDIATKTQKERDHKQIWLIDLAVPRNIDPTIKTMEHTIVYDMDYLQQEMERNQTMRNVASKKVERLLDTTFVEIKEWRESLHIHPILQALQVKGNSIQTEVFTSIVRKIPTLTEREKKVIEKHTKSMMNQLMQEPIKQLKQKSLRQDEAFFLQTFTSIFGIDDQKGKETKKINTTQNQQLRVSNHVPQKNNSLTDKRAGSI